MDHRFLAGGSAVANPSTSAEPTPTSSFRYEAQSAGGEAFRGTLEAQSTLAAQEKLSGLKLRVLSVAPAPPGKRERPLNADDFFLFNQQLAYLTQAGLPVEQGLRLVAQDLRSGRLSRAANAVAAELEKGVPLSQAFEVHARQFPPLYARLVEAGVQAGNLPGMLFTLGHHMELVTRLRQALWRVFAYPVMALVALAGVMLFIATVVLPRFHEIYFDFKTSLPSLTEALFWFGDFYPYIFAVAIGIPLVCVIVWLVARAAGKQGTITDTILLRLPLVGPVLRAGLLARWCDALRLAIEAGLDLPHAITLASDATGSPRLAKDGAALVQTLTSGASLESFHADLIPATIPAAIDLSSRAGDLPSTLGTISRMYAQQAEGRLRLLPSIVVPIMMIVVACAIGVTITALFLPLIKLVQSVSGGGEGG
jgi:type IV pilus assembly protein PilC